MATKALVIVHGAGKQMSDYYVPVVAAFTKVMGHEPNALACWYADLSNIGAPVFADDDPSLPEEERQVRLELKKQIREQYQETVATHPEAVSFGIGDWFAFVADLIADVSRYLSEDALAAKIQDRLIAVLDKAKAYDEVTLVSHSLGTVVAYDVLRKHAQGYNVRHLITMGSPLRKAVLAGKRPNDVGQIALPAVETWDNIYDATDLVANPIATTFPGYKVNDMVVDNGNLPIESHDYWPNPKVLGFIADLLN